MAKRRFNWKVAIVLVIVLGVLGFSAFGLRKWQRNRRAYTGKEKGLIAYQDHNWKEAARNLGQYVAVEKNDVEILLKYADAQLNIRPLKQDNVTQAVATYRIILRVNKNNLTATEKLVTLYLQMRIPAEAELIAVRYLKDNNDYNIRTMLAISLAEQRKFQEAAAHLHTIIEENSEQVSAYETLGRITELYPEEFPGQLRHWFNEAVKNNPLSAQAFIARAGFRLRNNDVTEAIVDLGEAEKLELSDSNIRLRLAREFANANMYDRALTHLETVYTQEPQNQTLWQIWAAVALKTGSKEEMLEVAQTGLKELASDPWTFLPKASELFIRCGELGRAGDCLDKLKQNDIALNEVEFLEGLLAEAEGDVHKAILSWQKAVQSGDQSGNTRLALATALVRAGDTQSAILQLRTLVTEQPQLFQGHFALARLLIQTGKWAEAAEQARLAGRIAPGNIDAVLLYIQTQLRLIETITTGTKEQTWQRIEKQLNELQEQTDGAVEVKYLQFQLALQRAQFAKAEQMLIDLKSDGASPLKLAMAEVNLLTAQRSIDEAVSKLHILIEEFPQDVLPVKQLVALLTARGANQECEKVLEDAIQRIEEPQKKRELSILLAVFYTQNDEGDKFYQILTDLSRQFPYDIPIKRQLLKTQRANKDIDFAQQLVDDIRAVEGEDDWQWRYEQAGIWYAGEHFKNRYPEIINLLKENVAANPADLTSRMLLGATYEKAGELRLAVRMYKQALDNSPDDIRIIVPTIAAMYKVKEYEQADEILNRTVGKNMIHPDLAKLKLQSYLRHGELNSAESILEEMMTKEPDNNTIPLSLALLNIRQNKYDQARELLNRLRTQEPDSVPVITALVELNVKQKRGDQALVLCDETVKRLGNSSAYILRGRTHVMLGHNDLAENDFDKATAIEPDNIQAWLFKSDFNRLMGRLEDALKDTQKALALDQGDIQIQKRAIKYLLSSNEPDKVQQGLELLDKAMASNPEDIELRINKVNWLLDKGTSPAIEQAQNLLQRINQEYPKITSAWVLMTQAYLKQSQFPEAMDAVLRGLMYSPNEKTLLLLKVGLEADHSPVLAIPTMKMLMELYPDDTDITFNMANLYVAAGQYDEAIALLKETLARCRKNEERTINIALAIATYKNGDKAEAQNKFQLLSQSAPDDPGPLLTHISLLKDDKLWSQLYKEVTDWFTEHPEDTHTPFVIAAELTKTEDDQARKIAEDMFRKILENDPSNIQAMNALAVLLQVVGRFEESAKLYRQVLEIEPDAVIAINNLTWIMCEHNHDYQQALDLAQRGLQKAPEYIDLIDTRGVIYHKMGQYQKAAQDFTRCIELYLKGTPSLTTSYFHLARSLKAQDRDNEAKNNLQIALALNDEVGGLSPTDLDEANRILANLPANY